MQNFYRLLASLKRAVTSSLIQLTGVTTAGLVFTLMAVTALLASPTDKIQADGSDAAHMVIQFELGEVIVRPVLFTAPISGLKALELTGLEVITNDFGFGVAVCSIEGVGCPAESCFSCDPLGRSWANTQWDGAQWQGTPGASSTSINNGAIEGWAWGNYGPSPDFLPPTPPPAPPIITASKAIDWLRSQQQANGSYGSAGSTAEAITALGANKLTGRAGYLLTAAPAYADDGPAEAGKLAVALAAAESCWPGRAIQPTGYYSAATGIFSTDTGRQVWAMLGTSALSQTVPTPAIAFLNSLFQPDSGSGGSGWEWEPGFGLDTNTTALAIQALVAAGEDPASSTEVAAALTYLHAAQNTDGGFPYDPYSSFGTDSDTNSTAYVVQALIAAGEDPTAPAWTINNTNPISHLLDMQLPDGSFEWQPGALFGRQASTQQAIPALLGRAQPVHMIALAPCTEAYLPVIQKD